MRRSIDIWYFVLPNAHSEKSVCDDTRALYTNAWHRLTQ
jgi:hypothetical protein